MEVTDTKIRSQKRSRLVRRGNETSWICAAWEVCICWRLQTTSRFYANGVPFIRWQRKKTTKYRMTRGNEGNGISPHPFICVFVFALGAFFSSSKYPLVMALKLVRYIVHPHVLAFVNMYMNNTTYNTAIIAHHKQAAALYLLFHAYAFLW